MIEFLKEFIDFIKLINLDKLLKWFCKISEKVKK